VERARSAWTWCYLYDRTIDESTLPYPSRLHHVRFSLLFTSIRGVLALPFPPCLDPSLLNLLRDFPSPRDLHDLALLLPTRFLLSFQSSSYPSRPPNASPLASLPPHPALKPLPFPPSPPLFPLSNPIPGGPAPGGGGGGGGGGWGGGGGGGAGGGAGGRGGAAGPPPRPPPPPPSHPLPRSVALADAHVRLRTGLAFWSRGPSLCFTGYSSIAQTGEAAARENFPLMLGDGGDDSASLMQALIELTQSALSFHMLG